MVAKQTLFSIKTLCLFVVLIFCCSSKINAQNLYTIQDTLIDSASKTPLNSLACILTTSDRSKTALKSNVSLSNADGNFVFKNIPNGKYNLEIRVFNELIFSKNIIISDQDIFLGKLFIGIKSNLLEEVKVVSRNLISQTDDRISYNVENDPQSKTANTLDIISKVPMLSTDISGGIKYLGTNAFKVIVNDKPFVLSEKSINAYLKTLPASSVKKIEVITNPSGRYQSEGVLGVINIVTKKNTENGLEGALSFEYRTPANGPSAGLSVSAKAGKFGFTVLSAPASYKKPFTQTSIERTTANTSSQENFNQSGSNETTTRSIYNEAGISFEKDSLNLFNMRFGFSSFRNKFLGELNSVLTAPDFTQSFNTKNDRLLNALEYNAGFDYQRNYAGKKAKVLNLSYLFVYGRDRQNDSVEINNRINYNLAGYTQFNRFVQNEHTLQLDFTNKPGAIKIDVGIKGIARLGQSDFLSPFLNATDFKNDQYILSAYNAYQRKFKKFTASAGYRIEYTSSGVSQISTTDKLTNHYFNLLPNASINYRINEVNSLQLNYLRTLRRPGISYLNPFINQLNPNLQLAGNPNLLPVKTDRFMLQYSYIKKNSLIASLSYMPARDIIQQILTNTDLVGVSRITYENIGKRDDLSLNLSYNAAMGKGVTINASSSLLYSTLNSTIAGVIVKNNGYSGDVNFGIGYAATKRLFLNGRFNYNAPLVTLQGKQTFYPYYVFSGAQTFFKDKLSLKLSLANPFSQFRDNKFEFSDSNINQVEVIQNYYRLYIVSASYRFGLLKSQNRSNRKSIQNADELKLKSGQ